MDLLSKIVGLKDKIDSTETEIKEIKSLLKQKTPDDETRELYKKIDLISSKINETKKDMAAMSSSIEELWKKQKDVDARLDYSKKFFEAKTQEISAGFDRITAETDKKLGRILEQILETSRKSSSVDERNSKEIGKLKIESELLIKQIEGVKNSINEINSFSKKFASNEQLHRHYSELKMDLATTEGKHDQQIEGLAKELSMIKSETGGLPKLKELDNADVALLRRIKELETKVSNELSGFTREFKEFEKIFAKKEDVRQIVKEEQVEIGDIDSRINQISEELNDSVEVINTKIDEQQKIAETTNRELEGQVSEYGAAIEQLRAELKVVREQVIVTQNAIVELNSFLRENMPKQ